MAAAADGAGLPRRPVCADSIWLAPAARRAVSRPAIRCRVMAAMLSFAAQFRAVALRAEQSRSDLMRAALVLLSALSLVVAFPAAQTRAAKSLDIYVVDVAGGNAPLR